MKRILLLVVVSWWGSVMGQSNISVGAIYTTHHYTYDYSWDTVSLVLKDVGLPNPGGIGSSNVLLADTILVQVCYWLGSATQPYLATDTVPLGVFSGGVYNITLIIGAASNFPFNTCDSSSKETFNLSFSVYNINADISREDDLPSTFRLSPNPATTTLTLQSESNLPAETSFLLYDITGRMVLRQSLRERTERIDVSALSKGMYLYSVVSDGEKMGAGKVIIE